MNDYVRHACGRLIGVQIDDRGTVYLGTWRELNLLQVITRCPGCGALLAKAEAAGELPSERRPGTGYALELAAVAP